MFGDSTWQGTHHDAQKFMTTMSPRYFERVSVPPGPFVFNSSPEKFGAIFPSSGLLMPVASLTAWRVPRNTEKTTTTRRSTVLEIATLRLNSPPHRCACVAGTKGHFRVQ